MRNNKNGLDEMQKAKRSNLGNSLFMLMFYALLFDAGLYGAGVRWLNYPANIIVIITVFMAIYLVGTIAGNAYLPPKAQNRKTVITLVMAIVFAIAVSMSAFFLFAKPSEQVIDDKSALILLIITGVGLLSTVVVAVIKIINNAKDNKND